MTLNEQVGAFLLAEGACAFGVTTPETLAGGPETADLSYLLPGARAAVTFAVPIAEEAIAPYLRKEARQGLERAFVRANTLASGVAFHLANYLTMRGYPSRPVAANLVYRGEDGGAAGAYVPDLAHRFLAVRGGVGYLGLSGNLITPAKGAAVILASAVTRAPLEPTAPLPPEQSYCDGCRLCVALCPARYIDPEGRATVRLGGESFSAAARRHQTRCDCVCSGYTGLHASGRWSTWSPGRFALPAARGELPAARQRMVAAHARWPEAPGGRYFYYSEAKHFLACAHCQLVCHPDRAVRKARYQMVRRGGVVVQRSDGRLEAMTPEKARQALDAMAPERRAFYEEE